MTEGSDWLERPVWACGMMRSGTTLLLSLLDGHPALAVYADEPSFQRLFSRVYEDGLHLYKDFLYGTPNVMHPGPDLERAGLAPSGFRAKDKEPFPAGFDVSQEVRDRLIAAHTLRGVEEGRLGDVFDFRRYFQGMDERLAGRTDLTPRQAVLGSIAAFAEACLALDAGKLKGWLFKQPMANFSQDRLGWFYEAFPQGRVVMIVRDPRGQYNSSLKYAQKQGRTYGARRSKFYFLQILRKIARNYTEMLKVLDGAPQDRLMPVFYEDLVADPEPVMRKVAAFLGIEWDDILTRPTRFGIGNAVVTGSGDFGARVNAQAATDWTGELRGFEIAAIELWASAFFDRFSARYKRLAKHGALAAHAGLLRTLYIPALAERAGLMKRARA